MPVSAKAATLIIPLCLCSYFPTSLTHNINKHIRFSYTIFQRIKLTEKSARSKRSPVPIRAKDEQDLSKVPGRAGIDYPLFRSVPPTNFHCGSVPYAPGIYANVETGCQAYHICHDGREGHQGASFLCPNGTLFNQHEFACDWWYNVNCADATRLYE
ncbi:unnamed protein product [Nesidiocoris tenuis]|uniref:Chitin-binding type-2 domain-containing protein n=1 Tax=Nesidiocoris tenuis TaxID=355587 RepID=A0A6H5HSA0_9HEMI|nr:unnamed protein product [Nesidiocoris tenuis]